METSLNVLLEIFKDVRFYRLIIEEFNEFYLWRLKKSIILRLIFTARRFSESIKLVFNVNYSFRVKF